LKSPRIVWFCLALAMFAAGPNASAQGQNDDEVPVDYVSNARFLSATIPPRGTVNNQNSMSSGIANIDSLANWAGQFSAPGVGPTGNPQSVWFYDMVGNPPELGGTTSFNAPIVPVSLDLRNADGSPRYVNGHRLFYDVTPFVQLTVNSPVFQNANYSSSHVATQFADAVQRAEFFETAKPDWHTLLKPVVRPAGVMVLLRGTYRFALNTDGSCCFFVLVEDGTFQNELFSTAVVPAIETEESTTKDVSTFLFPNTYLYAGHNPNRCCILGFHTYAFEPASSSNGNIEHRWVWNYSSWITPGIFSGGFQDVTALSHEIAETFNDPFVASDGIHNITPWWLSPNGSCGDILEVGDVIEGLPHEVFPITMNGLTYHPQNEALLQWFEFESPSTALDGAYSYPNAGTLQALSATQNVGCKP
jgi:hypothetical protein